MIPYDGGKLPFVGKQSCIAIASDGLDTHFSFVGFICIMNRARNQGPTSHYGRQRRLRMQQRHVYHRFE